MRKIKWDEVGKRLYETGVDHGVLYPAVKASYPKGVAWDGLINVNESLPGQSRHRSMRITLNT